MAKDGFSDLAPVVAAWLQRRGWIELPSFGMSMYPLIREGDVSRFESIQPEQLRVGDICLFVSVQGIMTGHRLVGLQGEGEGRRYLFEATQAMRWMIP